MAAASIYFEPKQKHLPTRRAKQRGRSFSQEVRNAVDLCLSVPGETEEGLVVLAKAANQAADRVTKRLPRNHRSRGPHVEAVSQGPCMSWAADAYAAIRKILPEDRIGAVTARVEMLATSFGDRRLIRPQCKFELLERMAAAARRALPEKSEK